MNLVELQRALRQLRCSGMAAGLEPRLLEAQTAKLAPIDFLSTLVQDELVRRYLERHPAAPLTLRQVDPLIRDLTHYRDVIARKTQEELPP